MRRYCLLLTAGFSLSLSAALAQHRPGPAYFLRHPGRPPALGLVLPTSLAAASPTVMVIPTVQAAALYTEPAPTRQLSLSSPAQSLTPRRDLTGVGAFPPYDPLQNLPEFYRQHTLPEARIEPWPVQLLRGLL